MQQHDEYIAKHAALDRLAARVVRVADGNPRLLNIRPVDPARERSPF